MTTLLRHLPLTLAFTFLAPATHAQSLAALVEAARGYDAALLSAPAGRRSGSAGRHAS